MTRRNSFVLCVLFLALPLLAQAQFTVTTNADNTLAITGYTGLGGNVTIPDAIDGLIVTSIESQAFKACSTLTGVTIPNSVNSIADGVGYVPFRDGSPTFYGAFFQCYNLTNVTLGNGIQWIGNYAFAGCSSLTGLTLNSNLTRIGNFAFAGCASLTRLTIPASVTSIGPGWSISDGDARGAIYRNSFSGCTSLTGVFFRGSVPNNGSDWPMFDAGSLAAIYYLPGSTGWTATFGGRPTAVWLPQMDSASGCFGGQTNLGFNISWASGQTVVVEAATNLTDSAWSPLATNTFSGDAAYFSDTKWTNYPSRFYRIRSP